MARLVKKSTEQRATADVGGPISVYQAQRHSGLPTPLSLSVKLNRSAVERVLSYGSVAARWGLRARATLGQRDGWATGPEDG